MQSIFGIYLLYVLSLLLKLSTFLKNFLFSNSFCIDAGWASPCPFQFFHLDFFLFLFLGEVFKDVVKGKGRERKIWKIPSEARSEIS